MLLILAAAAVSGLSAPAASAGQAGAAEESVKEARRLNPTSGIVRNPEAEPHADILVQNPRKGVYYTIEEADGSWNLSTGVILVSFDKEDGTMSVRDLRSGRDVLRQSAPVLFETRGGKARTVLTLTESPDEYFYGGGVQNGRFSHKGRVINIVKAWPRPHRTIGPRPVTVSCGIHLLREHTISERLKRGQCA